MSIGELTANMQIHGTYTDAGWDFLDETINGTADTWRLCVDGLRPPHLAWEFPALDFTCPDGYHFIEFARFQQFWGRSDCDTSNTHCSGADLDRSGTVDLDDLWALALLCLGGV